MINPHDPKLRRRIVKHLFGGDEKLFAEYLGHFKEAEAVGSAIPHQRAMIAFRQNWQKTDGQWTYKGKP